ncbi:MAG: HAMP domain-containing protein [Verrucomicrobia bacterium]|jgi:signal transduction histidine kinase/HAMP domain-containing protein|nr:HAMP domain-containing protein [Verrucomicrobiota bacterium]MBT7701189.1 HAMP domain-containing protein [Verrucomicrobiota bacterium]
MISARIRDLPFAKKVFLLLFVTLSISLLAAGLVAGVSQVHSARKELVRNLKQQAAILAHSGGSALVFQDDRFAARLLSGLAAEPSFIAGRFVDANGAAFASYPETAPDMPSPPESGEDHAFSGGHLDVWLPVFLSGKEVGSLWLRADTSGVKRQVSGAIFILGVTALIALGVGLGLSFPLQRTLVRPVGELARVAREVIRGQRYDLRAQKSANDELGALTDAFNDMMQHIEEQNSAMGLSEQRNRDLFESAPVALWEEDFSHIKSDIDAWRADGVTDIGQHLEAHAELVDDCAANVRVLDVNNMTLKMYRAKSKEQFSEALESLFVPESSAAFRAGIIALANGNTIYECEAPNRTLDGEVRQFLIRWTLPPGCETTWSRVLVSTVDITAQWQAQQELREAHSQLESTVEERTRALHTRTQDAEQLNRAMVNLLEDHQESNRQLARMTSELRAANKELEAFSYSVSHDLRSPLRSIDGFSRILLEEYDDRLDDEGREHLTCVRSEAQRMAGLIDDMLTLSRVTRREMTCEPMDLSAMAETLLAEMAQREPGRCVEVCVAPGLMGVGDPKLMGIALTNLLGNAWKFTSKTNTAKIEFGIEAVSEADVRRDDSGSRARQKEAYFVRDNGAGFDMRYADKLFVAFNRLHKPSDFPGTGIGLATVQRIIHRHRGALWASAEVGKGATFFFTLGETYNGELT